MLTFSPHVFQFIRWQSSHTCSPEVGLHRCNRGVSCLGKPAGPVLQLIILRGEHIMFTGSEARICASDEESSETLRVFRDKGIVKQFGLLSNLQDISCRFCHLFTSCPMLCLHSNALSKSLTTTHSRSSLLVYRRPDCCWSCVAFQARH
jgi:hypothetical protein